MMWVDVVFHVPGVVAQYPSRKILRGRLLRVRAQQSHKGGVVGGCLLEWQLGLVRADVCHIVLQWQLVIVPDIQMLVPRENFSIDAKLSVLERERAVLVRGVQL